MKKEILFKTIVEKLSQSSKTMVKQNEIQSKRTDRKQTQQSATTSLSHEANLLNDLESHMKLCQRSQQLYHHQMWQNNPIISFIIL